MHLRVAGLGWGPSGLGFLGRGRGRCRSRFAWQFSHDYRPLRTPELGFGDPWGHLCLGVTIPGLGEGSGRAKGRPDPRRPTAETVQVLAFQERRQAWGEVRSARGHDSLTRSLAGLSSGSACAPGQNGRAGSALAWLAGRRGHAATPLGGWVLNQPRTGLWGFSGVGRGLGRDPLRAAWALRLAGGRAGVVGKWGDLGCWVRPWGSSLSHQPGDTGQGPHVYSELEALAFLVVCF